MFEFGYILNKRYIFIKPLNSGAFSCVWLLFDINKNNVCVGKLINEEDKETGENEIKILKKLKKLLDKEKNTLFNNLLLFNETIYFKDQIIIIEEYQNLTLKDLIYDYKLSETDKSIIIKNLKNQILPILNFLKQNKILHTDIKPENIFIKSNVYNFDILIKEFIKELQNIKCKQKQKNKTIQNIILKYKKEFLNDYINEINNDLDNDSISDSDISINTDSDIHSDYDENNEIDEFLMDKIIEYKNKINDLNYENKKQINFDINNLIYSIGDFGNAIDYSNNEENNKINNQQFHDLQTRYYRHPNIIMRSNNILNSDFYAFDIIIKEIDNQNLPFDPSKSKGETTDHNHLKLLINNNYCLNCEKGRKTDIFFNYDQILGGYYLGK